MPGSKRKASSSEKRESQPIRERKSKSLKKKDNAEVENDGAVDGTQINPIQVLEKKRTRKTKKKRSKKKRRQIEGKGTSTEDRSITDVSSASSSQCLNRLSFGNVQVIEFEYTLGFTVTRTGPPIGLASKALHSQTFDIESYEESRGKDRFTQEQRIYLSPDARIRILTENGFSKQEIETASHDAEVVRMQRRESVLSMQWDAWVATKESLGRKLKRLTNPSSLFVKRTLLRYRAEQM
mmetsp:Transcript_3068/g.4848  ORF Transcript_3068/g.4848 Transcript_3068/m.4848 type:complete len:238 (-) Transcript_3068:71-784(-)|eukprot:CAMPEP_0178733456 /NCGR_PEP_ID=MMETSP0744-20121128/801_1 /TAXON_ID=913974 /ORGANISM="Nitzschia punctata, Strain CCMP561" /LENGTH=237 /DNA_ID=CAMNT_0020385633 /DNA_START=44 /DNA_END=757 /DNA_ORIENTATION=-